MNYIVNIIKLNISAERRKRVKDRENNILQYQKIIKITNHSICDKLKKTEDEELKKNIWRSLNGSQGESLAMNQAYIDFSSNKEVEDASQLHPKGNRNIIC